MGTWATAGIINVDSSSASDINKSITVVGLDANYNQISEAITLTTQTNNNSSNSFIRIFRAFVSDGETNVGQISVQRDTTDVAIITAGYG